MISLKEMNAPGVSLFQGADSIKVNTSLERAEEEEALEDQRRRHEELGNLLQNAFDDLEDDETTIDSTTNCQSDLMEPGQRHHLVNHHQHRSEPQTNMPQMAGAATMPTCHRACESEIHHLKTLLESRTKELENVQQVVNDEFKKRDELQKRLTITEAELDRALASKKNNHELLVESKEKCSNLENTINKLRSERKALEAENNSLQGKLETTQTLLADVQSKYDMVERDLCKHNERNAEVRRKQLEDRHRAEIEMVQQQLEQLANKLDRKSSELENMTTRYNALQNSHERMLVDKGSKINDLSRALDGAQKRCEELLSKPDYFQENIRLQKLVASLQDQIASMEKTIASLTESLKQTTTELDVMDSILHQYNLEDPSPSPSRQTSLNRQTQGHLIGSTPLNTIDRISNLKDELYRALANVRSKRDEIRKLQQHLEERQVEIQTLRQEENKSLVQITTLKEEKIRLENRLKILEEECEALRHNKDITVKDDNQIQALVEELEKLRIEHSNVIEYRDELKNTCTAREDECKRLDTELKNAVVDLEELRQEHENMKRNYEQLLAENQSLRQRQTADGVRLELEKYKLLWKDAQAECDRLKNLYVEISNEKDVLSFEMEKLRNADNAKELQNEREKAANLKRALQLSEVKASELAKILETEKLCHEREITGLRDKMDKERTQLLKATKNDTNNCVKCMDYVAEITKLEIQNLKLNNTSAVCKKEIDELSQALTESKAHIAELNEQLKLSGQQEHLIKELKTKATQFEEYIKSHSTSSEMSNSSSSKPAKQQSDKSVTTSPELERPEVKKIEARIRDEMAKIFATELKRYQNKLHLTQEQCVCLQREYQHISAELQQRQTEVDVLKQAILAEREKMGEILKGKENECKDIVKKQNLILHKFREELQGKTQKINELTKELTERQTQIEAERQSMKAVMKQWEEQRKSIDSVETEWKQKLMELQRTHESAIASWQSKYNSAKRTAANYKRYSEDKEAHMLKEYDRIKFEYDSSLAKIEMRMREALEKKNRELKEAKVAIENQQTSVADNKENKTSN